MKLVIIESPGKREALKKYLGNEYEVMSSKGHVRDLPVKTLGVDVSHNFEPVYEILSDKKSVISDLKKKAQSADEVLLATDPDREGEAISWHIAHCLGINPNTDCRIEFNEISKTAVNEALTKPRKININLVDAQQARRILDRLVGYKISPIICKKIQPKLSAGRVQSVALKLVVEREEEIQNFKPEEYWNIFSNVKKENNSLIFKLSLYAQNGKKIKIENKEKADEIYNKLINNKFIVENIKKSKSKVHAPAPFTTSTMQQDALNKLGMSLKKTSSCAQQLYEGVEIQNEGKLALITYIRTDSTRVSSQAQDTARNYVVEKFGKDYIPEKRNVYAAKSNAQDAHEAIRPISIEVTPESVKSSLAPDNYKLYKLIYDRFLASQMSEALYSNVTVEAINGEYNFKAVGKTLEFAGYTAAYKEPEESKDSEATSKIPKLDEGEVLETVEIKTEQKFTKPPLRYTEASLVKAMEEKGIGRPATYAPTITLLATRQYTGKDGRYLIPTELGTKITHFLDKYFKSVINVKFTAHMEDRLDNIAETGENWQNVISAFWDSFKSLLKNADANSTAEPKKVVLSGQKCPNCNSEMAIREGKYGKFLGCTNFPKCKTILPYNEDKKDCGICPNCGKPMVERKSQKGKIYYSCSGYPDCKFMSWDIPTGEKCALCGAHMIKTKNNVRCSNTQCKSIKE